MSLPAPRTGGSTASDSYAELEGPLIELAHRSNGDLRKLLTVFFGFLHRRTDFYCLSEDVPIGNGETTKSIGFKEGEAEKLLLAAFRQFPLRRMSPKGAPKVDDLPSEPVTVKDPFPETASASTKATDQTKKQAEDPLVDLSSSAASVALTEEGLQVPVGNGGTTDRYVWTQTLEECTVLLAIPNGIRGKDLHVELQSERVVVREKTNRNPDVEPQTFLDGSLTHRIVPSESTWTLESGVLQVVLYKHVKTFWDTVVTGDARIDVDLVDSRRNIDTYDTATQAQIRKIMFDQQQSAKGLPLSDELSGAKPTIPPLPPGVEYIDQEILDSKMKELGK